MNKKLNEMVKRANDCFPEVIQFILENPLSSFNLRGFDEANKDKVIKTEVHHSKKK